MLTPTGRAPSDGASVLAMSLCISTAKLRVFMLCSVASPVTPKYWWSHQQKSLLLMSHVIYRLEATMQISWLELTGCLLHVFSLGDWGQRVVPVWYMLFFWRGWEQLGPNPTRVLGYDLHHLLSHAIGPS